MAALDDDSSSSIPATPPPASPSPSSTAGADPFVDALHTKYIASLSTKTNSFDHVATEHLCVTSGCWVAGG